MTPLTLDEARDRVLTVEDVSTLLHKSTRFIYERCRRGELPGARRLGSSWVIVGSVFVTYLEQGEPPTTQ